MGLATGPFSIHEGRRAVLYLTLEELPLVLVSGKLTLTARIDFIFMDKKSINCRFRIAWSRKSKVKRYKKKMMLYISGKRYEKISSYINPQLTDSVPRVAFEIGDHIVDAAAIQEIHSLWRRICAMGCQHYMITSEKRMISRRGFFIKNIDTGLRQLNRTWNWIYASNTLAMEQIIAINCWLVGKWQGIIYAN